MEKSDPTPLLQTFLADRDAPCPRCRYNLRGLMGQVCPECGEILELRVGLVHPKQAWLITGLIGIAGGLGFNLLLLVYALMRVVVFGDGGGSFMLPFVLHNVIAGGVEGLALVLWLVLWRWIQRLPLIVRILLAVVVWGLALVNIVVFSFIVK